MQGSRNFYTALEKKFFIKTPDVRCAESDQHAIWIGLLVIAIMIAVAAGLAAFGWIIRRRERATGATAKLLRGAAWAAALLMLVAPVLAFASGFGPEGGRDTCPPAPPVVIDTAAQPAPITGALDLPAGRYEVVPHKLTALAAQLNAGGDKFD